MLDTMEKSFCGPPVRIVKQREKKKKLPLLWLGKRPSAVVLVGRHDAGSPCRPESVADVVDNHQDVASVISNWPAIARGFEIPSIQQNLLSVPAAVLNGVVHCLCGRRPKELLHLLLAFELQSSRSVLDSLHRQVKHLAPLLTNLSATVCFAVVESRSKCAKGEGC